MPEIRSLAGCLALTAAVILTTHVALEPASRLIIGRTGGVPHDHLTWMADDARRHEMGQVIAGMTMSLDGFVADADGSGGRLYPDFEALMASPSMAATIAATGAVVMGRRTFEMGDPDAYVGQYEFQVPIFVVTSHPLERMPKQDERLTFTFVSDGVDAAVRQARSAAGERDVQIVGGANVIQQALRTGQVDELHVDVMPVLLGNGLRLFDDSRLEQVSLALREIEQQGQRTGLRYTVLR